MRHHLLSTTTMTTTTNTTLFNNNKRFPSNPNTNYNQSPPNNNNCQHSITDIIILIIPLLSATFLISSYLSYIFHSISLIIPIISPFFYTFDDDFSSSLYYLSFSLFFFASILVFHICFSSKKCGKLGCKGLSKAMEFDLQLQTEECLKSQGKGVIEVDLLPWKGGKEGNPDYECLRGELRKLAPPNGRAVLIFRAKCGCPVAKLQGWSLKRGRKHKKSITLNGGDHC